MHLCWKQLTAGPIQKAASTTRTCSLPPAMSNSVNYDYFVDLDADHQQEIIDQTANDSF
jgi:hypothetical protein